ncbi:MAG: YegP family protein [Pseudomonadota bacterium]
MAGKFVITKGKDDKYYFNLKAGNGEVILTSQGYKAKADCMNGIESVKKNSQSEGQFEVKKSNDGKDYFVLAASNGQTIGKSQMYKSEGGCSNGMKSVTSSATDASVADESD